MFFIVHLFPRRLAFSLIELMVVVTIIISISGLSLVGYSRFQDRQVVNRAAADLAGDLRLAQQKAISGQKTTGWCAGSGQYLSGWHIRFTGVGTTYVAEGICCLDALCSTTSTSAAVKTAIPGGVIKSGDSTILFSALQGSIASTRTVTFTGSQAGSLTYSKTITVTTSGAVGVQ